uniref:Uncharacterized protein n=1 Tax=Arundo donax TaxID=35708 RepID=A0A0A9A2V4_ARUDO
MTHSSIGKMYHLILVDLPKLLGTPYLGSDSC